MKKLFFLLLFLGTLPLKVNGQAYRIYFKDKGSSQQMMSAPATFLLPDALERKALRQVPLSASDLPVAREYLQQLRQHGLAPQWSSRWFNYALVGEVPDTNIIKELPFVKRLETVHYSCVEPAGAVSKIMTDTLDYGIAANQIENVGGRLPARPGLARPGNAHCRARWWIYRCAWPHGAR
ncbi:MAG: hypothetical protein U5L96_08630 [Owenweeksia sp.]|nr:hypothetical protein [Owenweeksia sp.]